MNKRKRVPFIIASTLLMNVALATTFPVHSADEPIDRYNPIDSDQEKIINVDIDKTNRIHPRDRNFIKMFMPITKTGVNKIFMTMKLKRQRWAEKQKAPVETDALVQVA